MKRISIILLMAIIGCESEDQPGVPTSVIGKWSYSISVPPTAPGVFNSITFSGADSEGTFSDKNNHTGDWYMENDSIFWTYLNVPGLTNLYKGKVSSDFNTMEGTHSGVYNGDAYTGKWSGTRSPN